MASTHSLFSTHLFQIVFNLLRDGKIYLSKTERGIWSVDAKLLKLLDEINLSLCISYSSLFQFSDYRAPDN